MDTGRAGAIGDLSLSKALGLGFFARAGLLPKNVIKETLDAWPAFDFTNLNGGTLALLGARARFLASGTLSNYGWDLGATYSKVLMIVGGFRPATNFSSLMITDVAPPDVNLTGTKSYQFDIDGFFSKSRLLYNPANALTEIGTPEAGFIPGGHAANYTDPSVAVALYVAAGVQKSFAKVGAENWWPICEAADATFSSFAKAGFWHNAGANNVVFHACPLGIYAE